MLCICGSSGVGKDHLTKILINKYGYEKLVTYTTRPMREKEVNGVDYHFISQEMFDQLCAGDFFAETTSYKVANGEVWQYGTAKRDIIDDKIVILNPSGLKELKKDKSLNIVAVRLFASYGEIWNRIRERGDDPEETARRIEADQKDFEDIDEYIDFAIRTDGYFSDEEIADIINQIYSQKKEVNVNV